ncbi:polyphosphate:nucleotide phosphotransferase, PPK2 family [Polaribacter sp. Hel1_33_78]|nr:polyphosphate:nucleotide phosphotransferase, PPK2 family [Polaribacter sp. Hel1_33_78]
MNMDLEKYEVTSAINIKDFSTKEVIEDSKKELKKVRKKISTLQDRMYAEGKYSILICLQGMDTSGKDSLIREVFKDVNARGVEVHSFKVPTELELKHDFLWRHYLALPSKGKIGVFNRTHYENVLVTRVHPEYIFGENIPGVRSLSDLNDEFYHDRMDRINNFENHLAKSGTIILKFFLNLSKDEQKNRLLRRLNLPEKNWKFSTGDLKERKLWDKYQYCYEDLLNRTSKQNAPWFVIPADDKPTARLLLAEILLKNLKKYNFKEPTLPLKIVDQIDDFKAQLNNK